jgi:peptidoglycan/xylan/chitin deacetylase (PgdA/CDA1 family)
VTCWDWRRKPFATGRSITRHGLKARDGDVILLHDGSNEAFGTDRSRSVAATRHVLEQRGSQGFEFVTIPELVATARG